MDLTKALSYLTGSHVPQGSTVNVVGLDYDSPQNAQDSTTESMYLSYSFIEEIGFLLHVLSIFKE